MALEGICLQQTPSRDCFNEQPYLAASFYVASADENLVHEEIAPRLRPDLIGVAENLPFEDDSFGGVISIAILKQVRKPGGRLKYCVPLSQPMRGFAHHDFNLTREDLIRLPTALIEQPSAQELTKPQRFELAAAPILHAHRAQK